MYADITRDTFTREKHRARLRFQQGRAPLDAELNEQADLLRAAILRGASDALGPYWGPGFVPGLEATNLPPGFTTKLDNTGTVRKAIVQPGDYVVRGIAIHNGNTVPFDFPADTPPRVDDTVVLVLEVGERPVTAHDDPSLIDPALGSWDTAQRTVSDWTARAILPPREELRRDVKDIDAISSLDEAGKTGLKNAIGDPSSTDPTKLTPSVAKFDDARKALKLAPEVQARLDAIGRRVRHAEELQKALKDFREAMTAAASPATTLSQLTTFEALLDAARLSARSRGKLRATVRPAAPQPVDDSGDGPCHPTEIPSGYRGHEHRLYRVEIHRDGRAFAEAPGDRLLWKWSRDNGSVTIGVTAVHPAAPVPVDPPPKTPPPADAPALYRFEVAVDGLLDDARLGLRVGQVVELNAEALRIRPLVGVDPAFPLLRVATVDPESNRVGLEGYLTPEQRQLLDSLVDPSKPLPMYLRRWDHPAPEGDPDAGAALPVRLRPLPGPADPPDPIARTFQEIEDGIFIQFEPEAHYRRGDHWLIPARVGHDIEWPESADPADPVRAGFVSAQAPADAYAPLLLHPGITVTGGVAGAEVHCRRVAPIAPLVVV